MDIAEKVKKGSAHETQYKPGGTVSSPSASASCSEMMVLPSCARAKCMALSECSWNA